MSVTLPYATADYSIELRFHDWSRLQTSKFLCDMFYLLVCTRNFDNFFYDNRLLSEILIFDLDKSGQQFHHSLKEHHKISNIPKFRCEML
jgi:hypothetical protein